MLSELKVYQEIVNFHIISYSADEKSKKLYYGQGLILIESMMGLRTRQGNLRLVFRLFSLMRGLPSIKLK